MKQRSIKQPVFLQGIGIHSGAACAVEILPAAANKGLILLKNKKAFPFNVNFVDETSRGTRVAGVNVVEHLLAALSGLGIDNAIIKTNNDELPVLDGSALPFVVALQNAGIVNLEKEKLCLVIEAPIVYEAKGASLTVAPFDGFVIDFMINFPIVGQQRYFFQGSAEEFTREIAPARTFGFAKDLAQLKAQGLAKGASLENSLAIGDEGYINEPRFKDELVRHKILDLIGDFYLLGQPLKAKVIAKKTGHKANIEMLRRLSCLI